MSEDEAGLVHRTIPREGPSVDGPACKKWGRIASDHLFLYNRPRSNCRKWSAIPAFVAVHIRCVLVYRDISQGLRIQPMDRSFGGYDTCFDLRPGLMPGFPSTTG